MKVSLLFHSTEFEFEQSHMAHGFHVGCHCSGEARQAALGTLVPELCGVRHWTHTLLDGRSTADLDFSSCPLPVGGGPTHRLKNSQRGNFTGGPGRGGVLLLRGQGPKPLPPRCCCQRPAPSLTGFCLVPRVKALARDRRLCFAGVVSTSQEVPGPSPTPGCWLVSHKPFRVRGLCGEM